MSQSPYTHLTIQPANEDGACEVWGAYKATTPGFGTFDSDGIIGFLYKVGQYWVWLNDHGHPIEVFSSADDLAGYLQSKAPTIMWAETYRTAEERP